MKIINKKKKRVEVTTIQDSATLGVLVVGLGFAAGGYLDYFSRNNQTKLIAVADPDSVALKEVGAKYHPEILISDYKEALGREDIDLVVVCTPHYLHHSMVLDSLNAGKHVFCEKPLAISVKEADEMIDVSRECGKKLFTMMNMRFQPWATKLRELLGQGEIGRVFMARAAYLGYEVARLADSDHWKGDLIKAGGGVLLDGGYHIIDLMNSCLGPAKSVQASGGRYVIEAPNKGEDNISLLIEYEQAAVATLQISFTACSPGCHSEPTILLEQCFWGTEGSLFCHSGWDPIRGPQQNLELLKPDQNSKRLDLSEVSCPEFYAHFTECLLTETQPIVTALDARNTSAVVEAAYESVRTEHKVKVNWRTL